MSTFSLICTEEHEAALRAALFETAGVEGAAYVLFKEANIGADPWIGVQYQAPVHDIIPMCQLGLGGRT